MKVTHNPHQVREKLMACRILYQYICDIPMFLEPYAGRAVRALSDLTTSLVFDEEGALVIGTAVSDLVRMYAEERRGRAVIWTIMPTPLWIWLTSFSKTLLCR